MHDCPFLHISWFSYTSLGLVRGQICILGKKQKSNKSYSKPYQTALLAAVKCRCLLGLESSYFCRSCWNQHNSTVSSGTVHATRLGYCCWHSAWGLKAAVLEEDLFLYLHPDSEGLGSHSPPTQLVNGCVYMQCPWELLTDALHIAWMLLSQGNILFSLSLLPPHLLPRSLCVFWSVCCFLIFSLWRWKVACPACEGMETAVILLGQCSWAFSSKKLLRKIFPLGFFYYIGGNAMNGETCLVFSIHRRFGMN